MTAGVDSSQGGRESPPERSRSTSTFADIFSIAATPPKRRQKTFNEENKQFDPGGQRDKARLGTRLYSTFFSGESWEAPCLFSVCASFCCCSVCSCFPIIYFSTGDHFSAKLKDGTWVLDADRAADVCNRRASVLLLITLLKLARTSNSRFDRSADTLE